MDVSPYLIKDHIKTLVEQGQRMDGRGFEETRPLEVTTGISSDKSSGSAKVTLGDTQVIVGISVGLGTPYSDRPTSGVMTTSAELRPIASPNFELGPPRENSIELARVVDRGIRESGCIDMDKLFIEDEKVWMVFIDLHMIDDHGNLFDAAGIAAMAALLDARLPKYEDGQVIHGEWAGKLPITCTPIPLTVAKIGSQLVADPLTEEEYAMDARLTTATSENGLNAMQKGGIGAFTQDETEKIMDMAFAKGKEIRKQIQS